MKTVSVILSTYNGERYLRELLDSLRSQTRQPEEVLVSDDASTDGTVALVHAYIEEHHLHGWRVVEHEQNVGWKANFKRGILACNGDLVFPCDQDDIWDERKIELMCSGMEDNPKINLLACQVEPFYEGKNEVYRTDNTQKGEELINMLGLDGSDFLYTMRPGCAFCVRADFARDIAPWWKETYPHDATLWRFAAITGSLALYRRPLVSFRRHGDNASARGYVTRETRIADVEYYIDFFKQVESYLEERGLLSPRLEKLMEELQIWLRARQGVLSGKVRLRLLRTLWAQRQWYSTWKSPLVDLYCMLNRYGRLQA